MSSDDDLDSLINELDDVITNKPKEKTRQPSSLSYNSTSTTPKPSPSPPITKTESNPSALRKQESSSTSLTNKSNNHNPDHDDDDDDDLNKLISNLDSVVNSSTISSTGSISNKSIPSSAKPSTPSTTTTKNKCLSVTLTNLPGKVSGTCQSQLCIGCDCQVIKIDNYIWCDGVDYMFFRNNYPTFSKLKPQLTPSRDCSAYCCMCSWLSVTNNVNISSNNKNLKWRCLGH